MHPKRSDNLESALAKAAGWLRDHQRTDGHLPSRTMVVESCYKGPLALLVAGHASSAHRLLAAIEPWIRSDGDILSPREEAAFHTTHYLYAHGYLTIGAWMMGRFDVAKKLYRFIKEQQAELQGGFLSQGPAFAKTKTMDTVSTSISGWAALVCGDIDAAVKAARFLETVFHRQPSPQSSFYSTTYLDGGFVSKGEIPGEEHPVIDVRDPEQDWYFIGLPTVFLSYLYRYSGDAKHLMLAESYMGYLDDICCEGAFLDFSSGKSGVGAALLYTLTRKERYRQIAVAVADFILKWQSPSGVWQAEGVGLEESPADLLWGDMDMTTEYVLWLSLISGSLTEHSLSA